MDNLAKVISGHIIDKEKGMDSAVLEYGIKIIISRTLTFGLCFILAAITGMFMEIFLMVITIVTLRRYTGGYHANNDRACVIISVAVVITGCVLLKYVEPTLLLKSFIITNILGLLIVIKCAPVESSNHPLSKRQKKKYRKISIYSVTILLIIIAFLQYFALYVISNAESYSFLVITSSILIDRLKNIN